MNKHAWRGGHIRIAALLAIGVIGLAAHLYEWRFNGGPEFSWFLMAPIGALVLVVLLLNLLHKLEHLSNDKERAS
uniref:hypothetical protein n=1 Tax=Paractinoplanes polyasparticus TaxID=2856853 RepID=UPI001C864C23|nr:hypothetical protein [Actinoplanes polyasparticus]